MTRTISIADVLAQLDVGETADARVVLLHLRGQLLEARGEAPSRPVCPECGPHGNRGRVCLLLTWVECSLCAAAEVAVVS